MKIFFSVGEPSGDLHASNLIRRLKQLDPTIECVGFGGPKMAAVGCELLYELTQLAVMFIAKAVANLRFFFRLIDQADNYFATHAVDAVVLIDYSGFNWWIARKAKKHQIPVFYYGVPQVWAWGPWRIRKIRKFVDHVLCKLPFEVPWFNQRNCRATYVGHPYFDQLHHQSYDEAFLVERLSDPRPMVVLLPGSRDQEVAQNLPSLLDSAALIRQAIPSVRVAIASFNERQAAVARELIGHSSNRMNQPPTRLEPSGRTSGTEIYVGRTPELMKSSTICLACSGSVSLELMYHRKPTVIVYRIAWWAMVVQAVMIRVRYITLVNLIATSDIRRPWFGWLRRKFSPAQEHPVMPEYLTSGNPAERVASHAIEWLQDEAARQRTIDKLDELAIRYAKPGASELAADYILQQLGSNLEARSSPTHYRRSA